MTVVCMKKLRLDGSETLYVEFILVTHGHGVSREKAVVNWAFCLIPCVEIFEEPSFLLPGPVCKISQQADERKRFILADKSCPLVLRGRKCDILQATAQIPKLFPVIDASATTRKGLVFLLLVAGFFFFFDGPYS